MEKNDRIVPGKTGDRGVGCRAGMGVKWLKMPVREPHESIILEKIAQAKKFPGGTGQAAGSFYRS